jgi:hypothetical protein
MGDPAKAAAGVEGRELSEEVNDAAREPLVNVSILDNIV